MTDRTDRELLKMALTTLEGWANYGKWVYPESALAQAKRNTTEAITALRAALAEPVQEPWQPATWKQGCRVCGIGAHGETVGYVCPRGDCPTKVTCGGEMSDIPAFPTTQYTSGVSPSGHDQGMTLRDCFAAKAMQALITRTTYHIEDEPRDVSEEAYRYADAMLKTREAK